MGDTEVIVIEGDGDNEPETSDPEVAVVVVEPSDPDVEVGNDPLTERLVNIERDLADLRSALWDAEGNAAWALAVAENAAADVEELAVRDEEIIDAVDEAIVEAVEDAEKDGEDADLEVQDNEPVSAKVHFLFKPASDWFGKN